MKKHLRLKRYIRRFIWALPIILLPVVSCLLLGPIEIMVGNAKDFEFSLVDVMPTFCIAGLIAVIGGSLILTLLPGKLARYVKSVILAIGICSYVQYMFMNIKLSEDNGTPMDWSALGRFPLINLIIWIGIITIIIYTAWRFKQKWNTYASWLALALCIIQMSAIVSLSFAEIPSTEQENYELVGDLQYQVAPDENVIVFVLDTYGNTLMDRVVEKYPDALQNLTDFTYFDNADCRYYCTFPSMTHMLTGNDFDFGMNSLEWLKKSWQSERAELFFGRIKEAGYKTYLYSADIGYVYGSENNLRGKIDNVVPSRKKVDLKQACQLLLRLSAYRYVPYIIKPYFEVLTHEFAEVVSYDNHARSLHNNDEFYEGLKHNSLTLNADTEKAMIIQHLFGVHAPYTLSESGEFVQESTAIETGRGLLRIVDEYVNQLKELGVYERSTIIVMSDHGAWHGDDEQPIFFIKRSNEHNDELKINTAPISFTDFQATILSCIGLDYEEFGKAVYDWNDTDVRERTVYMRGNDDRYPDVTGSSYNVYYSYTYTGNKEDLIEQVDQGNAEILSATPW